MLRIGMATRDFTPERPAMIQGQMHRRVGATALDPLTLTAFAFESEDGSARAMLISCDMAYVPDSLTAAVRTRLAERAPDFPLDHLVMFGTHTHTSLVIEDGFYPHPGGDVMTPTECLERIAQSAADAAFEAWQTRVWRRVNRAFGHAVVGHNRRAVYADGTARMYGNTNQPDFMHIEGYEDHGLDMLFVWEPDGRLAGMMLVIPCPSQVDEGLEQFSADYWHDVREELRAYHGAGLMVLGLCGAAGDQSPHFLLYGRQEEEMRRRRGVTERQEIAERVTDAVARALACTEPLDAPVKFVKTVRTLDLAPLRVTREQRDAAQAEYERCIREGQDPTFWYPSRQRAVVEAFDRGEAKPVPAEVHALRLGDLAIVTNPFELFLDYGLRIKARSPAPQTLTVQLATGLGFYLPTARAVGGGHYGASPVVCRVGPEGGQQLVEASLAMLAELYA